MKRFKFPIRTTPEGSADPYGGKPKANMADIANDQVLFTKAMHAGDRSQFVKA
jgi:adenylylsulfate reductase subunit B